MVIVKMPVSDIEGGHWCVGVSCLFDYNRE